MGDDDAPFGATAGDGAELAPDQDENEDGEESEEDDMEESL